MMRSLWSGVSGLQAHQVGMDVIGDNIANVNTYGFKYSRADFATMLSQTAAIATAPQGSLGGKNPIQVGLGTTVASIEHIFNQGSTQSTNVVTDMAIQGNGFFVVSPDNGNTNMYTRAGNFTFDSKGNYVDSSGYTVQGWTRNDATQRIDTTGPIANIKITPGMTIPAQATTEVSLQANLTSGLTTNEYSAAYPLTSNSTTNASTYPTGFENMGVMFNASGKAFGLQNGQGIWVSFGPAVMNSASSVPLQQISASGGTVNLKLNSTTISGTLNGTSSDANAAQLASLINQYASQTGVTASSANGRITLSNGNTTDTDKTKNIQLTANAADTTGILTTGTTSQVMTAFEYLYNSSSANPTPNSSSISSLANPQVKNFHSMEDLRRYLQWQANDTATGGAYGARVQVNAKGQFVISNSTIVTTNGHGPNSLNIAVTSVLNSTITASKLFTQTMNGMSGVLPASATSQLSTQAINVATHTASINVFDSLGSQHTISFNYRKESSNQWSWTASVPVPGTFIGTNSTDQSIFQSSNASAMFAQDGSIANYAPQTLTISFNNGSIPNQSISLNWGTIGTYSGLTSFDAPSATSSITQDGYTGGVLQDVRIDATGVIVGSFSNSQSLGLAQVALANFANNVGLESVGSNSFLATANSGNAQVGVAGTGGRGTIQSSALEMSNVDLSTQLTSMIVIQRGYQANSKTITTSDQMLQVLLALKQ